MGFSCSWAAVRGHDHAAVLTALGFVDSGLADEARESAVSGAALPGGWYLVFLNEVYSRHLSDRAMAALSRAGEVVVAAVQEHAMYTTVAYFQAGARQWSIEHDPAQSPDHLVVEGEPPALFRTILAEKFAAQGHETHPDRRVDRIFEVPLSLAEHLTGFRHDQLSDAVFTRLQPAAS